MNWILLIGFALVCLVLFLWALYIIHTEFKVVTRVRRQ